MLCKKSLDLKRKETKTSNIVDETENRQVPKKMCTSSENNQPQTVFAENNNDDSIFSEINIEDLEKIDNLNSMMNDTFPIPSSQQFLEDLNSGFISPHANPNNNLDTAATGTTTTTNEVFSESQYETSDSVRNATHHYNKELAGLSKLNWHTEVFNDNENLMISQQQQQEHLQHSFISKGDFYGLPETVENLIYEHKNIKSLYDWQKECLNLPAIQKMRKNLIYSLPTSGGKTLVAEILMLREIICRRKNVIFILPFVSIVQEKVCAMAPFALELDFLVEEYTAGKGKCPPPIRTKRKSIFIASIEKGALLFDSLIEAKRANEIGLIVVDELHLIGDNGRRGSTLETFLTKVMFLNAGIQIIGMSATIGNLSDLSKFLNADIYTRKFRPVELKEYVKCGSDILEINQYGNSTNTIFNFHRTVDYKYNANILKADPDHLAGLVSEIIPNDSCLIFCSSRKNCENVAILLTKILPKRKTLEHKNIEKIDLLDAIDKMCGSITINLAKLIPYGIVYHHSGLTSDERKLLETAFRFGTLSVICCTSTLAAGVNLPAKRVIIRSPYVGSQFMTLGQYKQMIGRAGRAGMTENCGESYLICATKDNLRIGQMLFAPMDKILSSMIHFESIGLQLLIVSAIGLNLIDNLGDLLILIEHTLLAVQSDDILIETTITKLVTDILKKMFKSKVIRVIENKNKDLINYSNIVTTQEIENNNSNNSTNLVKTQSNQLKTSKVLSRSTKFELSTIGRAAFKAGIDYKHAQKVYNDLKNAQKSLVLTNYSHLLYLIVSFHSDDDNTINIEPSILFNEYNNLNDDTMHMVKIIGITEANVVKMIKNNSIKGNSTEIQFIRLYKVLILNDVLNLMPIHLIANKYNSERGMLQQLISKAVVATSCIVRLCEQIDEFWSFITLFEKLGEKLDRCCSAELVPLLELPAVKINRAKQFFTAGFKTIEDIAKSNPNELCKAIKHLPHRAAKEIISAGKMILLRKLESLQEETEAILSCLKPL